MCVVETLFAAAIGDEKYERSEFGAVRAIADTCEAAAAEKSGHFCVSRGEKWKAEKTRAHS